MCSTDYDLPSVWREKHVIARKEHTCSECYGQINKGDPYHYAFGVWDKKAESFKTCVNCCIPRAWIMSECQGYVLGDLFNEILEHAQEYREIYLYRWAVNIKRKWRYTS